MSGQYSVFDPSENASQTDVGTVLGTLWAQSVSHEMVRLVLFCFY